MELIDEIDKYLQETLSKKRYTHSVGVMKRAEELAKIYGIDEYKASLCGLAHDIAKEMKKEASFKYVEKNNIYIDDVEKIKPGLLHGKIGADIVKRRFGFSDDMQKAIEYHITANPEMDMLAKIIFVADKTELGRDAYSEYNVAYERKLSNEDIDEAILYIIKDHTRSMLDENKIIHPKSIETRNKIIYEKLK